MGSDNDGPDLNRASLTRIDRAAAWSVGAFAFVLPFHAIGTLDLRDVTHLMLPDWAFAVGLPFVAWVALRSWRELGRMPIVLACAALSIASGVSAIATFESRELLVALAKQAQLVAVVGGVGVVSMRVGIDRVAWPAVAGAIAAAGASLVGYLWTIASVDEAGLLAFVLSGTHSVFPFFSRSTGTFGHSPQHWGEYLVVAMAIALALLQRQPTTSRRRILQLALGSFGLLLLVTFSWAWIGGIVLLAAYLARPPSSTVRRWVLASGVAFAALAGSWTMNVGRPLGDDAIAPTEAPCASLNKRQYVTARVDRSKRLCSQSVVDFPYRSLLTTYRHAKETAWRAFVESPLLGHGPDGFEAYARRSFRDRHGDIGTHYVSPHCTFLQPLVDAGLLGLAALVGLLTVLWAFRPRHDVSTRYLWLGVVAMLVIGINIDVLRQRHVWLLLGMVATASSATTRPASTR